MRAVLFLAVGVVFFGRCGAPAPEPPAKEKPFVQVPDTLSPEAKKYLESLPDPDTVPPTPRADDLAGWKRAWEDGETATEPKVRATLKRYEPTVKERKFGGVPVLEVTPKGWKDNGKVLVHAHGGAYTMWLNTCSECIE